MRGKKVEIIDDYYDLRSRYRRELVQRAREITELFWPNAVNYYHCNQRTPRELEGYYNSLKFCRDKIKEEKEGE